jgi:hypothetical protein
MVFEALAADIAVRTSGLGAWVTAVRRRGRGLVPWLAESLIPWFGLGVTCSFRRGRVLCFAGSLIRWAAGSPVRWAAGSLIRRAAGSPVRWFGSKLVEQISRQLLARPFRRQQLLRAYGGPSEAPAGPLSLPVLSVPPSFRLWVGLDLTRWR